MMPYLAVIRLRGRGGRGIHLWFPLIFLWVLLLPFAVLALPLFFLYCLVGRVGLVRAVRTAAGIVRGLKGTQIQFEGGAHSASLRIA